MIMQVNVCFYFESLCVNGNAADLLLQSRLTLQLVRLLRNKHSALRERAAAALGLLFRHATYIDVEHAPQGSFPLLHLQNHALSATFCAPYNPN